MKDKEYELKYTSLRILKSIQGYLKANDPEDAAVYPIKVPGDLLTQFVALHGTKDTDEIIHAIFRLGLSIWADKLYQEVFGSTDSLENFIERLKEERR